MLRFCLHKRETDLSTNRSRPSATEEGNLSREQDQRLAQLDEIRIEVETQVSRLFDTQPSAHLDAPPENDQTTLSQKTKNVVATNHSQNDNKTFERLSILGSNSPHFETDIQIDAGFELLRQAEAKQSQLIAAAESRLRAQEAARHQIEAKARQLVERERLLNAEIEALREAEQEQLKGIAESEARRRKQDEAVKQAEAEARARAEEERQRLAQLEAIRNQSQVEARLRSEQEQQLQTAIEALRKAEAEQLRRIGKAESPDVRV